MPCKWARIPFTLQNMQIPLAHLCSILRSFDHDEKGRLTKIVLRYRLQSIGLLICTLIYENQGLEKSRSASNLRKISGPANLHFFLGLHLKNKLDLYYKPEKNPGDKLKKKSRFAGPENFLRFEADLDFSRP